MPASTPKIAAEELLHHLGWMKRLALSMLGDESLAEDAVSETYLRVLRRPPRPGIPLGGWLNTTLKRNVFHAMRSNRRRERNEKTADDRRPRLEPADPLVQAEATEYAVKALRSLEEPYRSTLLLHFFREMDAPAIARELGLTVSGVHTRLDRGKKLLRTQFRQEYDGNWTAPMLLTLGYKPLALSALVAGSSAATFGLPTILILATAAASAGVVWHFRSAPSTTSLEAAAAPALAATTAAEVIIAPAAGPPLPELRANSPLPPPASGDPPRTRWRLRLVTPSGGALIQAMGWERRNSPLSILVSDQPLDSLRPAPETRVLHSIPEGRFLPASREDFPPESGLYTPDYFGTLECRLNPPFYVGLALGPVVLGQGRILPGMEELTLSTSIPAVQGNLAQARVRLLGINGNPVTRGKFSLYGVDGGVRGWLDRPNGIWEFDDLVPGSVVLRASAPGHGSVASWMVLHPGQDLDLGDLALPPAVQISGSLFLDSGVPASEVVVRLEPMQVDPDGEPFLSYLSGQTDEYGRFRISGAAPAQYQLLPTGYGIPRSVAIVDARAGDVDLDHWQLPASVPVSLEPAFPAGTSWVVTVRDRRTGARVYSRRMGSLPATLALPNAEYQIEIGDPARGHHQVCRTFTVAGQPLEIAFSE